MTDRTATSRSATNLNSYGIQQAFKRSRVQDEPIVPLLTVTNTIDATSSNESIVTVIERQEDNGRIRYTARKIDRLNDKQARFESHREFLERCLTSNVIPRGLKLELEASIGNRNEEFLAKWNEKLTKFSRELTQDVIEFCGTTINETQQLSEDATQELARLANQEQMAEITSSLKKNQETRKHQLKRNKDKKFYAIKYNTNPRPSRPSNMDDDQEEQHLGTKTYPDNRRRPRHQYPTSDEESTGGPSNSNAQNLYVPRRQRSRNNLFPSRKNSFSNLSTKPRTERNNSSNTNSELLRRVQQLEARLQERPERQEKTSPSTNSYAAKLQERPERPEKAVPGTNIYEIKAQERPERLENTSLATNTYLGDQKQSSSGSSNQKNSNSAQSNRVGATPPITDMLDYITETMSTLKNFKQHLSALQSTNPTHSEMY